MTHKQGTSSYTHDTVWMSVPSLPHSCTRHIQVLNGVYMYSQPKVHTLISLDITCMCTREYSLAIARLATSFLASSPARPSRDLSMLQHWMLWEGGRSGDQESTELEAIAWRLLTGIMEKKRCQVT